LKQNPLQHSLLALQFAPGCLHPPASALFASPKQASAIPAKPTPNRFSACLRVTDSAIPLVISSNLLFMIFPFVFHCCANNIVCSANDGSISSHG
jgi:hypothetical protein